MDGRRVVPIKVYELSKREYVPVTCENEVSYGGRQQWFSDKIVASKATRLHKYGCGVIALADLFMYLSCTRSYIRQSSALESLEKDGKLLKENYLSYVEYIRDKYVYVLPKLGVPNVELIVAANRYFITHQMPYLAKMGYLIDQRVLLQNMITMLQKDLPVILLIGRPFPRVIYQNVLKCKKVGVTFYEQRKSDEGYSYVPASTNVEGHYVVVTEILIDKEARQKRDKVMLKISSWGKIYYMSYYEYCKYVMRYGTSLQGSIIHIVER